jgi:hypothetical protein
MGSPQAPRLAFKLYNNNFASIINIYFDETLSEPKQFALTLHSLDTLSDIRIKAFTLLF